MKRHGIAPAPKRGQITTRKSFLASHMDVIAGCDFFTVEVLTWRGLVTFYVLFFIHLESRRVSIAGMTRHPNEEWRQQVARNMTMDGRGVGYRYVLHDRGAKFCGSFRATLRLGGVLPIVLPPMSPNLNAFAQRWVRSIKDECLSRLILLGSESMWRVLREYAAHYHVERNHQGKGNVLLFPQTYRNGQILCSRRLGELLKFYQRAA
ncbi:MAG: hypothetical protein ABI995_00620 [Acidobacteriota bacterium]